MTGAWSDVPRPEPDCWLHPDVAVRRSTIEGRGLFARAPIPAGTVVSRVGGRLVSGAELRRLFADPDQPYVDTITVAADTHLVLPPRRDNGYGNHGCDPNLWWTGPYELAARRDIAAGEELTNDYATSTAEPGFTMSCGCGAAVCRGTVTGADWQRADLRARYGRHWVPALLTLINGPR
jgi:SET domain-containing protein